MTGIDPPVAALLADAVLLLHLAFILFVVFGGFLLRRHPRLLPLHLPAAIWGALVEFADWTCPLTPLENLLRRLAGEAGYADGFIAHYLVPIIYPPGLTPEIQWALGLGVLVINAVAYAWWYRARQHDARRGD